MAANVSNVSHKNLKPAKRYSKALVDIIQGADVSFAKELQEGLEFVVKTVEENPELKDFILNPVVSKGDKKEVLGEIFKENVPEQVLSFLYLLSDNSRLDILPEISASFKEDVDKLQNIVRAKVISAIELEDNQKNVLKEKLCSKTGAKIEAEYETDSSILGGIIIKIKDTVIDLSIKKRIENLKYLKTGER